jgi:hypothetical protein
MPGPIIPAAEIFRCGEGARYFDPESAPVQIGEVAVSKPACFARSSSSSKWTRPIVPAGRGKRTGRNACPTRCRDGAEKSYFVCQTTWGFGPATLIDYSSRLKVGRRESRTSRRFAPGPVAQTPGKPGHSPSALLAMFLKFARRRIIPGGDKVGRGVGQGYFAW